MKNIILTESQIRFVIDYMINKTIEKPINNKKFSNLVEQKFRYNPQDILNKPNKIKSDFVTPHDNDPNVSPTKKIFAQEILNQKIVYPDVAFAVSMLESGNLKSPIFRSNNNAFGMKKATVRSTTALPDIKNKHAQYSNWIDSIKDYKLWESFMIQKKNIKNKEQYIQLLNQLYCPPGECGESDYNSKIKSMLGMFNNALSGK